MTAQRIAIDEAGDDLIIEREGTAGVIRLNRPSALNAVTLGMVRGISRALDVFEHDPAITTVLLEGAGERGLCAGGDIRSLYDNARIGSDFGAVFWREEYVLDARIASFAKPFMAYMDGLVMGGGIGLAGHAAHRIVTDRTRLAMPEVGLGFFPDVGGTWILSRAPGEVGSYYGLTGNMMNGAEAVYTGFADHLIRTDDWAALRAALTQLPPKANAADVTRMIEQVSAQGEAVPIAAQRELIDRAFGHDSVEEIVSALRSDGSEFARKTLAAINDKSPRGLKLTLKMLRLGRSSNSLEECLMREYRAALGVYASADFVEGIRAAIIDKDRNPTWSPPRIEDVTPQMIESYLEPRGHGDLKL
ncbi:MAG: enoyl-CoA hydratase/isomerase family protein [Afipia sp.]|nr:enoyl-CoA hydratase/isomerase family protein [Afipia sp.]OJW61701.1 MAG: 3-hydroxyisobutyryl-CoA hydrolase [Afipia sp. 64-13]